MVKQVDVSKLRKELGWSQEFLAEHLGIAPAAVARWESGTQPPSPEASAHLYQLWLLTRNKAKSKRRRRRALMPEERETKRVQHIGGANYKTKVFQLGPDPEVKPEPPPNEEPDPLGEFSPSPAEEVGSSFPPPQNEEKSELRIELPYPTPARTPEESYREDLPDSLKPRKRRTLSGFPIKLGILVAVVAFMLFGLTAAGANPLGLSAELPELLTKVFPHLALFVSDVESDLIAIGRAYTQPGPKPTPSASPQESLDQLLKSVSAVNEQLGEEASDKGLFAEVLKRFRQTRDEAWQRATAGR